MANLIQRIFNIKTETRTGEEPVIAQSPITGTLNIASYGKFTQNKSLKLSTVYRCVNLLSDSIASLPLYPYIYRSTSDGAWKYLDETNSLYNLLNVQANDFMGAYIFKKMIVANMLLKGNAYIAIDRNAFGVQSLTILNSDYVQIYLNGAMITTVTDFTALGDNVNIAYFNQITGKSYDKSQIIHIPNYTVDGIQGISTLEYGATALGIAHYTNEHSNNFFKSGTNLGGLLTPKVGAGNVGVEKGKQAKKDFMQALTPELGGVSGGVVLLDGSLEYQPITVNPKDSQMIENKAFNVLEICRFFGVPPSLGI